jgi:hypothetical protein
MKIDLMDSLLRGNRISRTDFDELISQMGDNPVQ